jgi:hypothetical protein
MVATKNKVTENGASVDKSIHVKSEKGVNILAYNTGRICPPYCGGAGGEGFDWDNLGITLIDNNDGIIVV